MASEDAPGPCPVDALVALYHKQMPANPRVKVLGKQRMAKMRQRWRQVALTLFDALGGQGGRLPGLLRHAAPVGRELRKYPQVRR